MKEELTVAVVVFTCFVAGWLENSKAISLQQSESTAKSSLKLTTSILDKQYCKNGAVRMLLRLRYTNTGSEPIILPKSNFEFPRITVSTSPEAAAKRRYEVEQHRFYPTFLQVPFPSGGPTPSPNRFVILQPGESYEEDADPSYPAYEYLFLKVRKGNHVLQLSVRTWNEMIELAEKLSIDWRKFGILWWQGVVSEPMPFIVEKPASTIDCRRPEPN